MYFASCGVSAQPEGRHVFWAGALLLAPHRSTSRYARRSRLPVMSQRPFARLQTASKLEDL